MGGSGDWDGDEYDMRTFTCFVNNSMLTINEAPIK